MADIALDPNAPELVRCPYPTYETLRRESPVQEFDGALLGRPGVRCFAVARHEDVTKVLHDPKTFSSRFGQPVAPATGELRERLKEVIADGWPNTPTMLTEDPPVHTRYRRLVSKAFTPRMVKQLEPQIRSICEDLVQGFAGASRIDFITAFAVPLPVRAVAAILEVDDDHQDDFKRWADSSVAAIGRSISDDERVAAQRDVVEQQHYFADQIEQRRAEPRDDFLTRLVQAELTPDDDVEGGPLSMAEMLSIIRQIQVAGSETTASLLAGMMAELANTPDAWKKLQADPSRASALVEEGLRVTSPNQGLFRVVTTDTEVGGTPIPEGALLWVLYGSANHDEAVFEDPESFDPDRPGLSSHVAFGHGIHYCLGAALARLEAITAMQVLAETLDSFTVVEPEKLTYAPSFILRGLEHLELDVTYRA